MPTRPLLQSCAASQAMTSRVRLLLRRVLVRRDPLGGAGAAEVDAGDSEPALVAQALVLAHVRRGQVVHPVRERLQHDGGGGASGTHSRAASRTPSSSGIQARRLHSPILRTVGSALGGPAPGATSNARCARRRRHLRPRYIRGSRTIPSGGVRGCSPTATRARSHARSARRVDRDDLAEELGGRGLSHVDAALVEDVLGYHWLPLSLYSSRTRRSAARSSAMRRPAEGAPARPDRRAAS